MVLVSVGGTVAVASEVSGEDSVVDVSATGTSGSSGMGVISNSAFEDSVAETSGVAVGCGVVSTGISVFFWILTGLILGFSFTS